MSYALLPRCCVVASVTNANNQTRRKLSVLRRARESPKCEGGWAVVHTQRLSFSAVVVLALQSFLLFMLLTLVNRRPPRPLSFYNDVTVPNLILLLIL
jgi:hypothetical protein